MMRIVLELLIEAEKKGMEMASSNGLIQDLFPLISCYTAYYPEQCLVACTKYSTCFKCCIKATGLGNLESAEAWTVSWTTSIISEAQNYSEAGKGTPVTKSRQFHTQCILHDIASTIYRPFWTGFPLCNIHQTIIPAILHQLYQGVFKHLVDWCQKALGAGHLDARIRTLPPSYGVRHFKNGISVPSQISGGERKNMAKILLDCLIRVMPKEGILAIAALLDFIYIAQYSAHNPTTLDYLDDALRCFYQNWDYFIKIGVWEDFNIPKFHSLLHYITSTKLFGTTNNYNTELFECHHIDFVKEGWRASNQ